MTNDKMTNDKMSKLYDEVKNYIHTSNNICDHLYNGVLLEVFNEYSYKIEDEDNNDNSNTLMTLEDLLHITSDIIDSDYFGETLTTLIVDKLNKNI